MGREKKLLGQYGEEQATELLRSKGYTILERNYRCRFGEVDIIARRGEEVVFVEVRTRTSASFGRPEESVNYRKVRRLALVASYYLSRQGWPATTCRFDLVVILGDRVEHLPDAFRL